MPSAIFIRQLGHQPYRPVYQAMREHVLAGPASDELWIVEHDPVYTIGKSPLLGDARTNIAGIDVVPVDRGGDITYHGPGQIVAYPLLQLKRRRLFVRDYVAALEEAVIQTLAFFDIEAFVHPKAPGVYVHAEGSSGEFAGEAKIASIGVHVAQGYTYHGLALNVAMDLSPFSAISPCGYKTLRVTDMRSLGCAATPEQVCDKLVVHLLQSFAQHAH